MLAVECQVQAHKLDVQYLVDEGYGVSAMLTSPYAVRGGEGKHRTSRLGRHCGEGGQSNMDCPGLVNFSRELGRPAVLGLRDRAPRQNEWRLVRRQYL